MWKAPRATVEKMFFQDEIELYRNVQWTDEIGEDHDEQILVDTYKCNIQNGQSSVKSSESGKSIPHSLRISLDKDAKLFYSYTYKVKVKKARLWLDYSELWEVTGWTQGQLSTVMNVQREVEI